jgi:hypothetical protein
MRSYRSIAITSLMLLSFASCLKDKNIEDKKYGMRGVEDIDIVEFSRPETSVSFFGGNKDTTVRLLQITLFAESPAKEEIKVILRRNDALVTAIPGLELPPADLYKIKELAVVIPKDSLQGTLEITLKPDDLIGHSYALGFTIENTTQLNTNPHQFARDLLVTLVRRNRYDGVYRVTGTMHDFLASAVTGYFPVDVELHTMDENSVSLYNRDEHDFLQPILSSGEPGYYGLFSPRFTFDANGNITAVTNHHGQGTNNRYGVLDATGVNKWDPATRNITVKFGLHQPLSTLKSRFDEVFTYLGPRE